MKEEKKVERRENKRNQEITREKKEDKSIWEKRKEVNIMKIIIFWEKNLSSSIEDQRYKSMDFFLHENWVYFMLFYCQKSYKFTLLQTQINCYYY